MQDAGIRARQAIRYPDPASCILHPLLNSAAVLFADRVQAALGLLHAAPAAGPFVRLAGADGPRAGPAADARDSPGRAADCTECFRP